MNKIEFNVTPPDKLYLIMNENCLFPILNNNDKYIVLYKDTKLSMKFNKCKIYKVDAKQMHEENIIFDYVTDKDYYITHELPVKYVSELFSSSGFLHRVVEDEKIRVAREEAYTYFTDLLLDEVKKHDNEEFIYEFNNIIAKVWSHVHGEDDYGDIMSVTPLQSSSDSQKE